jgi:CRISP-associated protein Cas1
MTLSSRPPVNVESLFDLDSQPFSPVLAPGDRLGFTLRANPVVARATVPGQRGKRHDVVMDVLKSVPRGQRAEPRQDAVLMAGRGVAETAARDAWFSPRRRNRSGWLRPCGNSARHGRSRDIRHARHQRRADDRRPGAVPRSASRWLRPRTRFRLRPYANPASSMTVSPMPGLPAPRPIPIRERASILFIEKGRLDVLNGAFVVVDERGIRTHIPIGGLVCLMLEPGSRVSHAAVVLAARAGTLLIWVGEAGVRLYAAGQPGGARADRLLLQARLALDDDLRLRVVRKMYALRFQEDPPERRSIDQLRGIEGVRVRETYRLLAHRHGVKWDGRQYDPHEWSTADVVNRCLSAATSALYGVTEATVLATGYAPAIGFLHTGKPQSFVYDIADILKFETVVPEAFRVAAAVQQGKPLDGRPVNDPVAEARRRCRDAFRRTNLLARLIPLIEEVLASGGLALPEAPPEAMPVASEGATELGDLVIVVENAPPGWPSGCSKCGLAYMLALMDGGYER